MDGNFYVFSYFQLHCDTERCALLWIREDVGLKLFRPSISVSVSDEDYVLELVLPKIVTSHALRWSYLEKKETSSGTSKLRLTPLRSSHSLLSWDMYHQTMFHEESWMGPMARARHVHFQTTHLPLTTKIVANEERYNNHT